MIKLRHRVLSATKDEQKEAADRAENARRELGRIYYQIVQALTRKKVARAMESFLEARMFVQSNIDFMYTCLLEDQNELMLTVDWQGSMFVGLLYIISRVEHVKNMFPSAQEFSQAYKMVDQSFFRKDKRELITPQDQAPPDSVFEIYQTFGLGQFYDDDDEDDDDGKNQVATSSKVEVDRFKEEPIGRYVMPSDLYPIKANKREGRKK
mmetsp:Transcript_41065/g.66053  ORF Transcript_41065/g.66053 Transcript_41065/m.66053 type:complete len:209 (-) Transcript_41065:418-1044(-)